MFLSDVKNALEMDRRLHVEAVPPGARGADRAGEAPGLRGVPSTELHRRLPAHHPPCPPRDGAGLHRGGHARMSDARNPTHATATTRRTALVTGASSGFGCAVRRTVRRRRVRRGAGGAKRRAHGDAGRAHPRPQRRPASTVIAHDLAEPGAAVSLMGELAERGLHGRRTGQQRGLLHLRAVRRDRRGHDDEDAHGQRGRDDRTRPRVSARHARARLGSRGAAGLGRVVQRRAHDRGVRAPPRRTCCRSASRSMTSSRASGVTVTTLCPGPTATGFQERADMADSALIRSGLDSAEPSSTRGMPR